jgi:hypothetical protein
MYVERLQSEIYIRFNVRNIGEAITMSFFYFTLSTYPHNHPRAGRLYLVRKWRTCFRQHSILPEAAVFALTLVKLRSNLLGTIDTGIVMSFSQMFALLRVTTVHQTQILLDVFLAEFSLVLILS